MKATKTINISEENKTWLESLKVHKREPINDVLDRIREQLKYWRESVC